MNCVHGVRVDKPCPDCEYEEAQRRRGTPVHVGPKPGGRVFRSMSEVDAAYWPKASQRQGPASEKGKER